jgi:hypothetical protein
MAVRSGSGRRLLCLQRADASLWAIRLPVSWPRKQRQNLPSLWVRYLLRSAGPCLAMQPASNLAGVPSAPRPVALRLLDAVKLAKAILFFASHGHVRFLLIVRPFSFFCSATFSLFLRRSEGHRKKYSTQNRGLFFPGATPARSNIGTARVAFAD